MINWAHMAIAMACLAVLLMVGAYFYLTHTAEGQRIMARMGYKATSTALWEVGEEKMDVGDIDGAIADFLQAREQDGEENINVDGCCCWAAPMRPMVWLQRPWTFMRRSTRILCQTDRKHTGV